MPDLSIVIVNYNTRDHLQRCLESIQREHHPLAIQVIVVDNGSKDGSAAMARQTMPEAVVIEPGYNTWFTGGNNLGMRVATGDYVLILNPDTLFPPGTLPKMVTFLREHPKAGALTCQMRFPDGRLQPTGSLMPTFLDLLLGYTFIGALLAPIRDRRHAHTFLKDWDRQSNRQVEVIPDSNMMSPLSLLQKMGGFDERLRLYFTEDDICQRIRKQGYEVHYLADALLTHVENASTRQVQRLASQVYFDDMLTYTAKYFGAPAAWLLRLLIWPTRQLMDLAQRLRGERKSL
jgi:GT2 family glycosyltransferase